MLLYSELAEWWPLMSAPEEYVQEARVYRHTLLESSDPPPKSILELGSGGGNNASHLKTTFDMTLVDRSPQMLAVSRRLNPECEHIEGDLRTVRLDRQFDSIFVHDAIDYMTTLDDLLNAMKTAFAHCRPGGCALFVPDLIRETFQPRTDHGGNDGAERSFRYLEWNWDPDPQDSTYVTDFIYALREHGNVRVLHDRHVFGLHSKDDWMDCLATAGFRATAIQLPVEDLLSPSFIGYRSDAG